MKKVNLNLLKFFLIIVIVSIVAGSCGEDEEDSMVSKAVTLISDADNDGYIANSSPRLVNTTDASITIGWSDGISSRGFVSFDLSGILPSGDKTIVIEKVVLRIHQKKYNMLPFTGKYDGLARVAEAYLISFGTLDKADYDLTVIANCGVLASSQLPLYGEASLDVTSFVASYLSKTTSESDIQFRIQLTQDSNTSVNVLDDARWLLFSGEDTDDEDYMEYRPALEITYHWENS